MITLALLLFSVDVRLEARGALVVAPIVNGYGAFIEGALGKRMYEADSFDVRLEVGATLGYENAPYANIPWLSRTEVVRGAEHRVHAWLVAGVTLAVTRSRRLLFGLHACAGLSHVLIEGYAAIGAQGVSGTRADTLSTFVIGLDAMVAVMLVEHLGLSAHVVGHPLPSGFRASGYMSASFGLLVAL